MLQQRLKQIGALLVVGSLGIGLGYYLSPTKVKIEERIVEKEKVTREQTKRITEKFDIPTGKVTERITETGDKQTFQNKKTEEVKKEKVREKKQWAVKAGARVDILDPKEYVPVIGLETRLPVFDSFLGIEGVIDVKDPQVGVYWRIEF